MLYETNEPFSIKEYFSKKPLLVWLMIFLLMFVGLFIGIYGVYQLISTNEQEIVTSSEIDNRVCEQTADFGQITVYISGAINNPGVYLLENGDRVGDVIETAGGVSESCDKSYVNKEINLAKKIIDGDQIYIPTYLETEKSFTQTNLEIQPISINSSTKDQIVKLSGIGDVRASKIIENRPYGSVSELVEKSIISESLFAEIEKDIQL